MFISQLVLDQMDRQAMRLLTDVYSLHKAVMSGFRDCANAQRVLFRVEPQVRDGKMRLLVQSGAEPSWGILAERCRGLVKADVKEFSPLFRAEDSFRFRLRANPTVTRDGKRFGLVREEALVHWLQRKEERLGVRFLDILATDEGYVTGRKVHGQAAPRVNIKTARFEGRLRVCEPNLFLESFTKGIGPGKAFGCGLLSLARR